MNILSYYIINESHFFYVKETKKRLVNVQQVGKSSSIILVRIAGMLICILHGSCTDLEYM